MHISKDDAYDDNNNATTSIYQSLVFSLEGLQWLINVSKFKIIDDIMSKTFQNIVFMLRTVIFVANDIEHGVQVRGELTLFGNESLMFCSKHDTSFIELCESSKDNGAVPNSSYPSIRSFDSFGFAWVVKSIPYLSFNGMSFVLNVVGCIRAMFWAFHITSKLYFLDYDCWFRRFHLFQSNSIMMSFLNFI